ncbi:protease do : Protease Do OS=Pirellula staleyi (strain ATCC 27377 / DSM 6068 / ICPB 4128) GN=Psta_1472 PE=4 SV=1: Trypsin_2: PDZ_2 [Gemmata massiliana]|uniref:PDZ domain-containing protein n=1 Tax=Gemmata massiliana TaxID=1210884 RepID=A0A6P2CYK4_9BACT|nr:trypsin-like peptidase domain-containing protein [Gemmata massiliana]VTR93466.1 protease do : Protease Do OS=Pirellula staleyi (strain ATCC 27377 / DSM 6068 / ICPB 4128) GN=Psta_1472 PE=4 SV=1: Trypsin_2: PDZ_2 [Gemmata massiliana]
MKAERWALAAGCLALGLAGGSFVTQQISSQPAVPQQNQPLPGREWQSLAPVAKRVLPGVVCIEGKGRVKRPAGEDTDPGFGSGVLIDPTGTILTSNHVVTDLDSVEVTLNDGRKFITADIRRDPRSDIALVKIESKEPLPFIEFGDSDAMEIGDRVLAVGAPFGLTGSVTSGIVSAKGRNNLKLNQFEDFIQTDAAMNPGNSGGALVNLDGKVIGLTAAIKTRSGGFQGVGLAVSSNLAKKMGDELLKNGPVRRPAAPGFGIAVRDLDEESAKRAGARSTNGAVVTNVADDSPAAKAGITNGDVITKINGEVVKGSRDVQKITATLPANQVVDVLLWRDGKFYVGKVKVEGEHRGLKPDAPPAVVPGGVTADNVGLALADLTAEYVKKNSLPQDLKGAVITTVARNSLGEKAGLTRGLIVLKVDKTAVTSAASFDDALQRANVEKGALLHVLRANGDVDFVVLRLK